MQSIFLNHSRATVSSTHFPTYADNGLSGYAPTAKWVHSRVYFPAPAVTVYFVRQKSS